MNKYDLRGMSRDELTDLLSEVMIRLRHVEAEEIKNNFVTKSQKLRMEAVVNKHLQQNSSIE